MHIRQNQLNIFSSACVFDASNTMAARVFEHIEAIGADVPGILVVFHRVAGKLGGKNHARLLRRDGKYLCLDLPDGSIIAVDGCQMPGAWLVAVESRTAWELGQNADLTELPWALVAVEYQGVSAAA